MAKIEVKTDLLKWASARSGRPFADLTRAFPKLIKWIQGEDRPTFKQLEDFAGATYTPFGYFFLDAPPVEKFPIPFYRTIDTLPDGADVSANLFDTVQMMKFRQSWMREHLIERGISPLGIVQSTTMAASDEQIAQRIREALNLKPLWASAQPTWTAALDTLRRLIEEAGVLVIVNGVVGNNTHRKLDPQEFRGFVLVDEYAPLLFVNGADGKAAQMFTLAHELAHLFLGLSAAFDLKGTMPADNETEKKCDRVAAELLVPRAEIKSVWNGSADIDSNIPRLAKHFKVSEIVVARRALDLDYISKTVFFNYYNEYLAQDKRAKAAKSGGGDFYINQKFRVGKRFAETVICAAREGTILYSEAYRLTGLRGKTFDEFAYTIGCEV